MQDSFFYIICRIFTQHSHIYWEADMHFIFIFLRGGILMKWGNTKVANLASVCTTCKEVFIIITS